MMIAIGRTDAGLKLPTSGNIENEKEREWERSTENENERHTKRWEKDGTNMKPAWWQMKRNTVSEQEKWKSAIKVKIKIGNPNKTNASRTATLVRDQNSLCIYDVHIKRVCVRERETPLAFYLDCMGRHEIVLAPPSRLTSSSLLFYSIRSANHFIPTSCPHSLLSLYRETEFFDDSKSFSKQMLNYSLTRADLTTKWKKNYADSNAML